MKIERSNDQPNVLVKWYDCTKWVLHQVDRCTKNQRFMLRPLLADAVAKVLERLSEAAYSVRIAKGGCRSRPCRDQEPTDVPAGDFFGTLRRISHGSATVSSRLSESRGGVMFLRRKGNL
jgi:hypothetical protein